LIVRSVHAAEFAVSPKQSGLSWSVLDERPLSVAKGDELRLRAVGQVAMPDGKLRRIANGSTVTVAGVDVNASTRCFASFLPVLAKR
jgi:hypothetical protein